VDKISETPHVPSDEPLPGWDTSAACRRLRLALADLGLDDVLGVEWDPAGVDLRALTARQADALVRRLEDIARALPASGDACPGPGQGSLFSGFHTTAHRHGGRVQTEGGIRG
jgi:hypothetical protein